MTEQTNYQIWVNWNELLASLRPAPGFDAVTFFSREKYQENLSLLIQSGFRFQ